MTLLYAPDLHPKQEGECLVGGQVVVGWDLILAVNTIEGQRQVWSFDGSTNPLACLMVVGEGDPTPDAQLLAMCVPLAERFHPSYVRPMPGDSYDTEA